MSLKVKLGYHKKAVVLAFAAATVFLSSQHLVPLYIERHNQYTTKEKGNEVLGSERQSSAAENNSQPPRLKLTRYEELSPNGSKKIITYEMSFEPSLYEGYYDDYFYNKIIIAVKDMESRREEYIFTGEERTGNPLWLGNNHIVFTAHCGTACKGLYLVNTTNKETAAAVWGYLFLKNEDKWETRFKDWFGKEFAFEGLVDELETETIDNKSYLIFKMKDDNGNFLYNKRFLFAGQNLESL